MADCRRDVISDTLNRRENEVMGAVFALSAGKERFLAAPSELLAVLPPRAGYNEEKLERVLRSLELDGYFDLISSERKGETVYVVHMHSAGLAYRRESLKRRRAIVFRWGVAAVGAVITFLIGVILKLIFN